MQIDIDRVHRREPGMEPFEVMISESQERMMAVVEPAHVGCGPGGLPTLGARGTTSIGEVTTTGRLEIVQSRERSSPMFRVDALAEEGPVYERPLDAARRGSTSSSRAAVGDDAPDGPPTPPSSPCSPSPNIASKRWVWEQYDHMIFLGTIQGPGGDAAVIRLPETRRRGCDHVDGPGRYCYLDPYEGARLAVAEAARNVACVGAKPLAITNCLNFGNPEKPDVMWQFAEVVRGMGDACRGAGHPGDRRERVLLQRDERQGDLSDARDRDARGRPRWTRSAVGLALPGRRRRDRAARPTRTADFGGSEYAKVVNGTVGGEPPRLDLDARAALSSVLFAGCRAGSLASAHDLSGRRARGRAVRSRRSPGAAVSAVRTRRRAASASLFSESPSRAVVTCRPSGLPRLLACGRGTSRVAATVIGTTGGDSLGFGASRSPLDQSARTLREAPSSRPSQVPSTDDGGEARDACGVVGIYAPGEDVARLTYYALYALQHRGQEAAGIAISDGQNDRRLQGARARRPGLRRNRSAEPARASRDRSHPVLDDGFDDVGERAAHLQERSRQVRSPSLTTATSSTPSS